MTIQNVTKINVSPGETIVVTVDIGKMPPQRARTYMRQVADHWRQLFPNPSIQISVHPSTISFAVIGTPSSGGGSITPSVPLNPVDAYDKAMGVI